MEFTDEALEPFGETLLAMKIPTQLSFKTPLVFRMVKELKEHDCLPWTGSHRAELCFDEAITNAMMHGNDLVPEKTVTIRLFADADRWGAIIEDQGEGFGAEQLPNPEDPESLLKEQGRGIMLMEGYLDELRYSSKGNRLRMVRRRQTEPDEQEAMAAVLAEEPGGEAAESVSTSNEDGVQVAEIGDPRVADDNVEVIRSAVVAAADAGNLMVLDLSHVEFVSSVGIGMLITLYKHIRSRNGHLILAGVQPPVEDILESARLIKLFQIAPDRETAVTELKKLA